MKMQYKIGQILTSTCETELETVFGRKIKVPAGNKTIIGADKIGTSSQKQNDSAY